MWAGEKTLSSANNKVKPPSAPALTASLFYLRHEAINIKLLLKASLFGDIFVIAEKQCVVHNF